MQGSEKAAFTMTAGEREYGDSNPTGTKIKHISDWETPTLRLEVHVETLKRRIFCV